MSAGKKRFLSTTVFVCFKFSNKLHLESELLHFFFMDYNVHLQILVKIPGWHKIHTIKIIVLNLVVPKIR